MFIPVYLCFELVDQHAYVSLGAEVQKAAPNLKVDVWKLAQFGECRQQQFLRVCIFAFIAVLHICLFW